MKLINRHVTKGDHFKAVDRVSLVALLDSKLTEIGSNNISVQVWQRALREMVAISKKRPVQGISEKVFFPCCYTQKQLPQCSNKGGLLLRRNSMAGESLLLLIITLPMCIPPSYTPLIITCSAPLRQDPPARQFITRWLLHIRVVPF